MNHEQMAEKMVADYKNSLEFGPACAELLADAVLLFIRRNLKFPSQDDMDEFKQNRDDFITRLKAMKDGKINKELGCYDLGCLLYLGHVDRLRKHYLLNPMPEDYNAFTFLEHQNRDMDYPFPRWKMLEYKPGIPVEMIGDV